MALVFLLIGVAVVAIGVRGQASQAGALLTSELTGSNSFLPWAGAILILGLIGAYRPARPFANGMLVLVVVSIVLAQGKGFFGQLQSALANPIAAPSNAVVSGSSSSDGSTPTVASALGSVATPTLNAANVASIENAYGFTSIPSSFLPGGNAGSGTASLLAAPNPETDGEAMTV